MKTFYLDMDGVVADFDAAAKEFIGFDKDPDSHRWALDDWVKIREQKRWFKDLPKTPWADHLVSMAREYRDEHGWQLLFLTAIPKGNDFPWAFQDKMIWVQNRYPDIPVHFGPYSVDKQVHCKPGDILVDDRLDNCEQWKEAGGHSIRLLYRDPQPALNEVASILEDLRSKKH